MSAQAPTRVAVLGAAIALATSCSSPPSPSPGAASPDASADTRSATLGDTIHVPLGRSALVDRGRLVVAFRSHGSDSRCPANVTCVWAGDVPVRVAARAGGSSVEVELHTGIEPRTLTVESYVVKLVGMLPYPGTVASQQVPPTPTALLVVTR